MNKRCIVNVATGDFYCKMQNRLRDSFVPIVDAYWDVYAGNFHRTFTGNSSGIDLMTFRDCLPSGSLPHSESPYGFKVHAIKAAYEKGYTSILWLDSPAYAVKEDISPIFDKIEKEGYYAMSHFDPLKGYVSDKALERFKMSRESLENLNLPSGSCYGFNLKDSQGLGLFLVMEQMEQEGLFQSSISYNGIGSLLWNHRHDEAILGLILKHFDKPVFTFDPLFQSDSPECVIKSGGE